MSFVKYYSLLIRNSSKFKQVIIPRAVIYIMSRISITKVKNKKQNEAEYETKHLDGSHFTTINCQESSSGKRTSERTDGIN